MSSEPGLMDGPGCDATGIGSLVTGAPRLSGRLRSAGVSSIGICAQQSLLIHSLASVKGEVVSRFEHSLLVRLDSRIICVTSRAVGDGPFNLVLIDESDLPPLGNAVEIGSTVTVSGGYLCFQVKTGGDSLKLAFRNVPVWDQRVQPLTSSAGSTTSPGLMPSQRLTPPPGSASDTPSRDEHLTRLVDRTENLLRCAPVDSLASTVLANPVLEYTEGVTENCESPLVRVIKNTVTDILDNSRDSFCAWLDSRSCYPAELDRLLGLGPGLTPSGDDFLAGCLIALRVAGRGTLAIDWYDQHLGALVGSHTHPLSAQMLEQAARGRAGQKIIKLNSQLVGRRSPDIAACCMLINDIGHSSGWDYLSGFLYCCQRMLSAGSHPNDNYHIKYHRNSHA